MALQLISYITLLSTCGYAFWAGGRSERICASVLLVGSLVTGAIIFYYDYHWLLSLKYLIILDFVALAVLLYVALTSDRYWPIWLAAFQLPAVVSDFTMIINPKVMPLSYALAQGFWIYPMLMVLFCATRAQGRRSGFS